MILRHILQYRNDSNFTHSSIKSYDGNPPEKMFFDHAKLCLGLALK